METIQQKLFSPNAAAKALDVSRSTIYQLMKCGALRWVPLGTIRRIPAEEIERLAANGAPIKRAE